MPVITLLTDFGMNNEYAGTMKGVILSINPSASVVDINHQLDPYDTTGAAYQIKSYFSYFPRGTVHVAVVDPGVGGSRGIIVLQSAGHCFLAPDNGVLTPILKEYPADRIFYVENDRYFLKPVSNTFHGRDIFAPVAAHLSLGEDPGKMGKPADVNRLCILDLPKSGFLNEKQITGTIVSIDRFGNLITNIESSAIDRMSGNITDRGPHEKQDYRGIEIRINNQRIRGLSASFDSAAPQEPLAIIGSRGFLEIAVNRGNAQHMTGAVRGDTVTVAPVQTA